MNKYLLLAFLLMLPPAHAQTPPLQPVRFQDLTGWNNTQALAARPALLSSCRRLSPGQRPPQGPWGSYQRWQQLCTALAEAGEDQLQDFFERNFQVYRIGADQPGLFTGYYSPVYEGRRQREPGFAVPLLKRPADLLTVNPRLFGQKGELIIGKQVGQTLKPYDTRAQINEKINRGAIEPEQVLAWIQDSDDRFFLQIQGSGHLRLKDGQIMTVAYDGNNGHPYTAIGTLLKQRGELQKVSLASIRQWLKAHPDKRQELFNQNARYIFFRQGRGAITAQGVPATAHRTLAVDPRYIPYGLPLWLDSQLTATGAPYRQMMVSQDTGSAIRGPVRGDIYMGMGRQAEQLAGPQQAPGRLYVMLPRKNTEK